MKRKRFGRLVVLVASAAIALAAAGCRRNEPASAGKEQLSMAGIAKAPDIQARLAKYAPTEIGVDAALVGAEDRQVLAKLLAAARRIDGLFWKQSYPEGLQLKAELEKSSDPADKDYLRFLLLNYGPFDRADENRPFLGTDPKPAGANFYPRDMSKEEFEAHVAAHPEDKEAFESPFTVIRRREGKLVAVPYSEEYRADLEPLALELEEAAALTSNPSLKKYLAQRAKDLLSNDYYQSDCDWIDLRNNLVEIVIGPYEVYEDALFGLKASYETFVYINDREAMAKIKGYLDFLEEMQQELPVEQKYKDQSVGHLESPLNVVFQVYNAGDCRAGVQTSAFVLPNDEQVREKKGSKKVFLKNVMEAKFRQSFLPISRRVLAAEDVPFVSFDAYFNETILHEICHVLGINYVTLPDGTKTTVNKALRELNAAIEEAKADVVGVHNVDFLVRKGWLPKEKEREAYTTYLAGMFRSMRFGVSEAHGQGTLVQFNFLR
ncbi:MAG: peptidase, partial [Candidatus Aminicenantes bacterium]|nr:peptidase [Candidatus Aminicenantes bacterium]